MSLLMHRGGHLATLSELRSVPLPKETDSYKPVSHYDLSLNLGDVCQDLLSDYRRVRSRYGLARKGRQMFGVHTYRHAGEDSMGLSIGFRNSYDKSMSVGIAIGASVFVCDNLALTGDIAVMRKHTMNVWQDLEEMIITTIYRSQHNFQSIHDDAGILSELPIDNDQAYRIIGLLFGRKILSSRQLPVAKKEWLKPSCPTFSGRSMWSFYNACTESLKSSPPNRIMENHIALHDTIMQEAKGEPSHEDLTV